MWGGYRNGIAKTPWQHDTMVNMFSTTKGIASLAVSVAASRGLISYDAKVVDYWPEFAQAGKAEVTVRQLLGSSSRIVCAERTAYCWPTRRPVRLCRRCWRRKRRRGRRAAGTDTTR